MQAGICERLWALNLVALLHFLKYCTGHTPVILLSHNPEIQQEGFVQLLLVKPQWRFYGNNIVIVVAMEREV